MLRTLNQNRYSVAETSVESSLTKTFNMSPLWRTIMVQIFMRDSKKVSALWSVCFRVFALERFCYKGLLRNSSRTKLFVRLREVSALEDVCFREVPLYSIYCSNFIELLFKDTSTSSEA